MDDHHECEHKVKTLEDYETTISKLKLYWIVSRFYSDHNQLPHISCTRTTRTGMITSSPFKNLATRKAPQNANNFAISLF
mmetsp:Transcript_122297/g.182763  ORF Transcript_122297/g.182763 Transcript_122297/m.182763 type:complete len:80 (-) Transcript_122297:946-1185(-)